MILIEYRFNKGVHTDYNLIMQSIDSLVPETLVTIPARFDGHQIKLDVPYPMRPDTRLLVTVLQPQTTQANSNGARYSRLLALRGVFANDDQYDEILREIDTMWQSWNLESA